MTGHSKLANAFMLTTVPLIIMTHAFAKQPTGCIPG